MIQRFDSNYECYATSCVQITDVLYSFLNEYSFLPKIYVIYILLEILVNSVFWAFGAIYVEYLPISISRFSGVGDQLYRLGSLIGRFIESCQNVRKW